eukprot:scaffold226682_cov35-Prasinocladus_malaysianus.AAC.1
MQRFIALRNEGYNNLLCAHFNFVRALPERGLNVSRKAFMEVEVRLWAAEMTKEFTRCRSATAVSTMCTSPDGKFYRKTYQTIM